MHTPQGIGIDDFQANRSPTKMYRTAPLQGLMTHQKGGFYHDGRFPNLRSVVEHYDGVFKTFLTESEKADLVAYLTHSSNDVTGSALTTDATSLHLKKTVMRGLLRELGGRQSSGALLFGSRLLCPIDNTAPFRPTPRIW